MFSKQAFLNILSQAPKYYCEAWQKSFWELEGVGGPLQGSEFCHEWSVKDFISSSLNLSNGGGLYQITDNNNCTYQIFYSGYNGSPTFRNKVQNHHAVEAINFLMCDGCYRKFTQNFKLIESIGNLRNGRFTERTINVSEKQVEIRNENESKLDWNQVFCDFSRINGQVTRVEIYTNGRKTKFLNKKEIEDCGLIYQHF